MATTTIVGEVVFGGDTITCAAAECNPPATAQVIDTNGAYIYPGFIDAHNHVAYGHLFPREPALWHAVALCRSAPRVDTCSQRDVLVAADVSHPLQPVNRSILCSTPGDP